MAINLANLAAQGRAYSASRPWEPEELESLILLERGRGISRTLAADFVRNGIATLEDYDKAVKVDFKPKTLDESAKEAEVALKENGDVVKKAKRVKK